MVICAGIGRRRDERRMHRFSCKAGQQHQSRGRRRQVTAHATTAADSLNAAAALPAPAPPLPPQHRPLSGLPTTLCSQRWCP